MEYGVLAKPMRRRSVMDILAVDQYIAPIERQALNPR
jgi:hypothetical protein